LTFSKKEGVESERDAAREMKEKKEKRNKKKKKK